MNHLETFHQNFKTLIEHRGMSTRDAARALDVSNATISRYMNGMRLPELDCVIKIARFFDVSIDWLVGLSDTKLYRIPDDAYEIYEKYTLASPADKGVIKAILARYDHDNSADQ